MFDHAALAIDIDNLLIESELNLAKALDLLVYLKLQKKANNQKIYPESIKATEHAISKRMIIAIEKNEFVYEEHPYKSLRVRLENNYDECGYCFENATAKVVNIISWAKSVGIVPKDESEYHSDLITADAKENSDNLISVCHQSDFEVLNIKNIKDPALQSFGDDQYQAVRFYSALFAGLLMSRRAGTLRKEDLEKALIKMGFNGDLKVKSKDFEALWRGVPDSLKLQGKPPSGTDT